MPTLLLALLLAAQDAPRAGIAAWDTVGASAEPLTGESIEQKSGWKALPNRNRKAVRSASN